MNNNNFDDDDDDDDTNIAKSRESELSRGELKVYTIILVSVGNLLLT